MHDLLEERRTLYLYEKVVEVYILLKINLLNFCRMGSREKVLLKSLTIYGVLHLIEKLFIPAVIIRRKKHSKEVEYINHCTKRPVL